MKGLLPNCFSHTTFCAHCGDCKKKKKGSLPKRKEVKGRTGQNEDDSIGFGSSEKLLLLMDSQPFFSS